MTFNEMIQSDKPVLVDFFAEWCGPCKMMAPVLKQVKDKMGDSVSIIKINVDKNQQAASAYGVQAVPTFILFKKGVQLWRKPGAVPAGELEKILKEHI